MSLKDLRFQTLAVLFVCLSASVVAADLSDNEFENGDDATKAAPIKFLCYWGSWAYYRTEMQFTPASIDPHMCTHLIYSFAGLNKLTNKIGSLDPYLDYAPEEYELMEDGTAKYGGLSMMREAVGLKAANPDLKVLIAIGGWGQGSERFSKMAASSSNRLKFIKSVVSFIRDREFDGLDMDWEYPALRGGKPEDKENFVILLKELREAFDDAEADLGKQLLLTAAVGAGPATVEAAYNVSGMAAHLDFINIMAYDLKVYVAGEWEQIGHHSPLYPKKSESPADQALSVSAAVENFIALGARPVKLALGVGAYGKTYTMTDSLHYNFYDPASGPGVPFGISQEAGSIFYNEICYYIARPEAGMENWNFGFDYEYYVPFGHNGTTWIGYDDEMSINEKVDYAYTKKLGGMMIWSIDQDDFQNYCGGWYRNPIGGTVRRRIDFHGSK